MRKTKEIVINDRGTNKSFKITEMSASKFEWWLIRVGRLLLGTGIGNQVDVDSAEDVQKLIADTLLKDGLKSLGSVNLAEAKDLYDDLLRCCELKSDDFYMPLDTDTIDGQIESVKTLFTLRKEALMLHLDFLESAAQSQSATAAKSATSIIKPLKQKTSAR